MIALFLGLIACGAGQAEPTQPQALAAPPTPQAVPMQVPTLSETTGLPETLAVAEPLWEATRGPTARKTLNTTRVYANGQLWTWSDQQRYEQGGLPRMRPAPWSWRLTAQLSPDGLRDLQALLDAPALAATTSQAGAPAPDAPARYYRFHTAQGARAIALTGAAANAVPAPLREAELAIQRAVVPGGVPMSN